MGYGAVINGSRGQPRAFCADSESLCPSDFVTEERRKIFVHIGDTDKIFLLFNGAKTPVRMIASQRKVL